VVGVMLVAWVTNHLKNGFFIFRPGEGWEYVMVLTMSGFLLATVGPGEWSVDNAVGHTLTQLWGWKGLLIAVVAGVGGSALLLLTFWRPDPKPAE